MTDLQHRKYIWRQKVHPRLYQISRYRWDKLNRLTKYLAPKLTDNIFHKSPVEYALGDPPTSDDWEM
jgi:hypothetical protein